MREALDFLKPTLEQKNIKAVTHLDGVNPLVSVNADELRQVLLNLAANAQDALVAPKSPGSWAGGGREGNTLVISTVAEADNVTLLVRDNGVGIPEDAQQRIFEPFFSTKPQGSGLGLALVRRVISGAGGTVFCESVVGEGTTFRIVLPRATPGHSVASPDQYSPILRPPAE
ncbi:MAG: ATP-binding protein [Phycisphaerae bacterium]